MSDIHHDGGHAHPTEKQYWIVFAVLAAFTAVEVAWSYLGLSGLALVVPLIVMMVVKFLLVAGIFMHLYFDLNIIHGKLFAWTFGSAILLAIFCYFAMFGAFEWRISGAH